MIWRYKISIEDCKKHICGEKDGEFLESVGQKTGGFGTAATSKVELFVVIVNGCKSLVIITKSSTLDVAAILDPPLKSNLICNEKMYWKKSTC